MGEHVSSVLEVLLDSESSDELDALENRRHCLDGDINREDVVRFILSEDQLLFVCVGQLTLVVVHVVLDKRVVVFRVNLRHEDINLSVDQLGLVVSEERRCRQIDTGDKSELFLLAGDENGWRGLIGEVVVVIHVHHIDGFLIRVQVHHVSCLIEQLFSGFLIVDDFDQELAVHSHRSRHVPIDLEKLVPVLLDMSN